MVAWGLREVQGYTLSKYYCPAPRVRKASYHPPTYFLQLLNSSFFCLLSGAVWLTVDPTRPQSQEVSTLWAYREGFWVYREGF